MQRRPRPTTLMFEAGNDTVVFTFGRMNPPTTGHRKLIQKVAAVAKQNNADHVIYLSHTAKPPKDPLEWNYKKKLANATFPGVNISDDAAIRTPFQALEELGKQYRNVIMVVGDDRVEAFTKQMAKYTEGWGIENFQVISAGTRDPDAEGVEGMSASKARQFAMDGDYGNFALSLPNTLNDNLKKDVFQKLRTTLGAE